MKILTFLGLGPYEEATYYWENKRCTTALFPEALAAWFPHAEMIVLLTDEAKNSKYWDRLKAQIAKKLLTPPQPIHIPSGKNQKELWDIFDRLTQCLSAGDEIVFDVTHAFRSLPILALLAVAYLRTAQAVNLTHLFYGAHEARDERTNLAPVFDLSPFITLLEWVTATDQFIKTGNGEALALLLPSGDPATGSLAQSVKGIAQGLHLLRPMEVMQEAAALANRINAAKPRVSLTAPPLASLLQRIEMDYGTFGLANPIDFVNNGRASLERQLKMAEWYLEKGQIAHAISLAREWLPSLLCYHFQVDPLDVSNREDMELLLNGGKVKDKDGNVSKESPRLVDWPKVPNGKQLRSLWSGELNLANLRNDVLHAGFRKNPRSAKEITDQVKQIITHLRQIAVAWNLEGNPA